MPGRLEEQPHQSCQCCHSAPDSLCEGENRRPADHGEHHRVSGFDWASSRERNVRTRLDSPPLCCVTMKLLGVGRLRSAYR
jgi:hypothetical protein